MKTKISLLLIAILCSISVFAQNDFDKYFEILNLIIYNVETKVTKKMYSK